MARQKFTPEYSSGDILSLYRLRSDDGDEARIRSLATNLRMLCRMEHNIYIPETYKEVNKEVRTPYIRDSWHRITSSLVNKPPVAHVYPKDEQNKESRESANIAERWDTAFIERVSKDLSTDIIYSLTAQLVRDGESILKVVHRPDAWANFPLGVGTEDQDRWKRGAALPIAWKDIDRLQILYDSGEYGDSWFIEYGEYAKPYLGNKYDMVEIDGRLRDPKRIIEGPAYSEGLLSSSRGRSVKMEFFTDREWHVLIDGSDAPGWPKPNPYRPYLPYFRASAYELESLLYSLLFLAPRLDELLTMKMNWGILAAYPNPVIESIPGQVVMDMPMGDSNTPGEQKLVWTPGKAIELPEGKRISFLEPPAAGKDLNELITILKSLIDVAGVPNVMRGIGFAGDAGYLANQQRAAAEMSYKLAAVASQRQLEKGLEFTHWLIENVVKQTVYVRGWSAVNKGESKKDAKQLYLGLSPDKSNRFVAKIDSLGEVEVRYRPQLVTDSQAAAMIALQLTNAAKPLYSRREALERIMQEEDADSILEDIDIEDALNTEPLKSIWVSEALRESGMLPQDAEPKPGNVNMAPNAASPIPSNMAPLPGEPGVPGLTMPMLPGPPQGGGSIPGNTGGRAPGTYPGQPSGPQG